MNIHDREQHTWKQGGQSPGSRQPPAAGTPTDKLAGQAQPAGAVQPEADRLAGKGTGMDTDSSQGSNLGL